MMVQQLVLLQGLCLNPVLRLLSVWSSACSPHFFGFPRGSHPKKNMPLGVNDHVKELVCIQ